MAQGAPCLILSRPVPHPPPPLCLPRTRLCRAQDAGGPEQLRCSRWAGPGASWEGDQTPGLQLLPSGSPGYAPAPIPGLAPDLCPGAGRAEPRRREGRGPAALRSSAGPAGRVSVPLRAAPEEVPGPGGAVSPSWSCRARTVRGVQGGGRARCQPRCPRPGPMALVTVSRSPPGSGASTPVGPRVSVDWPWCRPRSCCPDSGARPASQRAPLERGHEEGAAGLGLEGAGGLEGLWYWRPGTSQSPARLPGCGGPDLSAPPATLGAHPADLALGQGSTGPPGGAWTGVGRRLASGAFSGLPPPQNS